MSAGVIIKSVCCMINTHMRQYLLMAWMQPLTLGIAFARYEVSFTADSTTPRIEHSYGLVLPEHTHLKSQSSRVLLRAT